MKKYENPVMNVSLFDTESIVTESSPTAMQQAEADAANMEGSQGTFKVQLVF